MTGYAFCCPMIGMYGCKRPKCRCVENWNAERESEMKTPLFAWYDFWVGAFWDRKGRKLYILPLPMVGVVIQFPQR